jgi:hypothetical protein
MIISWIKKLLVKTSPVEPVAVVVEESPARKPIKQSKKRGRPFGSKNKGMLVQKLKTRPQIRKGERPSNFNTRLKRWKARNDSAKTKGNTKTSRQPAGNMADSNQS